ncbi:hypothetical protein RSOLAG22IIIB_04893 [Rhizoctonia solani]|uniref:BTB domain-containing protein n=1 Tax=Rhizoctonia solani TaxID=456999 RepID=A0A0K6G1B5_9AGAM|nr:hypothetical protein RSOLAG22IIIB_04893 [Rhizoctonia solani]
MLDKHYPHVEEDLGSLQKVFSLVDTFVAINLAAPLPHASLTTKLIMSDTTSKNSNILAADGTSGEVVATESYTIVRQHEEFFFDDALVAIQIEDTLFNVHKYQLLKGRLFPEHPIKIEGVKATDFAALLKVLYAGQFCTHQLTPTVPLIIPALRLATMWGFLDLYSCLLPLATKVLGDIDKVLLAKELGIDDWLACAHIRLCQRREPLTTEEAGKLGMDSVLLITRMREQNASKDKGRFSAGYYCSTCSGFSSSGTPNSALTQYNNMTCKACQAQGRNFIYYGGGGTIMAGTGNSSALEAEVKKWVQDGCMFKD